MRKIIKAISILLAICTVFLVSPAAFCTSAGTLDIGDAQAVYNQSVSLPVTISANAGVWGMKFFVYYPKALTLTDASSNGVFGSFEHSAYNVVPSEMPYDGAYLTSHGISDASYSACCLIFENFDSDTYEEHLGVEPSAQNAGGTIGSLTFTAPRTSGVYEIMILPFEAISELADDVVLDHTGGAITVVSCFHNSGSEWRTTTPASCTENGVESYMCIDCGEVFQTRPIAAAGHISDTEWTTVTDATCTEDGEKVKYCTKCNSVVASEIIPSKGHTEGMLEVVVPASCTTDGSYIVKCTVCQTTLESGTIPATGHIFSKDYTIDIQPDGYHHGEKSRHCLYCDVRTDITEITRILLGDANEDGYVTVKDSLTMKKHLIGMIGDDGLNFVNSDIDKDGAITLKDRKYLIKYLVAIITDLNSIPESLKEN